MLKNKQEIENWLNEMKIRNFIINDDLTINVNNKVDISNKNLTEIPVQFNKINGYFDCSGNENLTSLKGCPQIGITYFRCRNCNLENLKGAPKEIKGVFNCRDNKKLKSLKGCPQIGIIDFICRDCDLRDLEGPPKEIKDWFDCSGNKKLQSLKGCPQTGITDFWCYKCNLENLEGAPKEVKNKFDCEDNKNLKSLKYAPKSKSYTWSESIPKSEIELYIELLNEVGYDETQEIWDDYAGIFAI